MLLPFTMPGVLQWVAVPAFVLCLGTYNMETLLLLQELEIATTLSVQDLNGGAPHIHITSIFPNHEPPNPETLHLLLLTACGNRHRIQLNVMEFLQDIPFMVVITEFWASVQYYESSGEENNKCKPISSFHWALNLVRALPSAPPGTLPSSVCLFFFVICPRKGPAYSEGEESKSEREYLSCPAIEIKKKLERETCRLPVPPKSSCGIKFWTQQWQAEASFGKNSAGYWH